MPERLASESIAGNATPCQRPSPFRHQIMQISAPSYRKAHAENQRERAERKDGTFSFSLCIEKDEKRFLRAAGERGDRADGG